MKIEIVRDDCNIIENVLVDGKEVKRSFMRGLKKAQKTAYWFDYSKSNPDFVFITQNVFGGDDVFLNALEYSIYKWVMTWQERYSIGSLTTPIQAFDDMRYFFMSLNRQAYMELLD